MTVGAHDVVAEARERRSPGLAALFDALYEDGRHAILDLGPASGAHLRILGRFASQVRFAGLLTAAGRGAQWHESVQALRPNPTRPYDVVLAWDVLERVDGVQRASLLERLVGLTAPRARLYAVAGGETGAGVALSFTLLDRDRVAERVSGVTPSGRHTLLPAEMERVLAPFEVASAFMLRTGAREYVALKRA